MRSLLTNEVTMLGPALVLNGMRGRKWCVANQLEREISIGGKEIELLGVGVPCPNAGAACMSMI